MSDTRIARPVSPARRVYGLTDASIYSVQLFIHCTRARGRVV